MNLGIAGKLALVVGASRGIGREVAVELAGKGCDLAVVARDSEKLFEIAEIVGKERCTVLAGDLMHSDSVSLFGSWFQERYPDIIYYAIGGSAGVKDAFATSIDYAKVWQYNLGIAIDINRLFLPGMIEKGWGRIVLTSTDGVRRHIGNAPYTSAKHALEGYVSIVGRELADKGVVMTAVAPGPIYTEGRWIYSQPKEWTDNYFAEHLPTKRFGDAKEAAKVVAFLCSEHAAFMAGAIVPVDGGSR